MNIVGTMVNDSLNNDIYSEFIQGFYETYHIDYKYGAPLLVIIVVGISLILVIKTVNKLFEKPYTRNKCKDYSERQLIVYDPELDANMFQDYVFDIYVKICKYWTENDYENLKKYLTLDLYNSFCNELSVLKQNSQRNIIDNVKYVYSVINNIRKENQIESVEILLTVELNNYTIDSADNIVFGSKNGPMKETYILTFQKLLDNDVDSWVLNKKKILKQEVVS